MLENTEKTESPRSDTLSPPLADTSEGDRLYLPRWIVYFQAALLGLVASTFFIFGILVGSLGSDHGPVESSRLRSVSGSVVAGDGDSTIPDAGAVVLLLPNPPSVISRQDPSTIRPGSFEPLENPTIDWIEKQGGVVVRTNIDGKFDIQVRPGLYHFLVISKASRTDESQKLSKEQVAALSEFFLPVDQLIRRQNFQWQSLRVGQDSLVLGTIEMP